ncbi:MAG: S8 family serine peptidase [Jatrophihabitans sp.]
MVTNVRKMGATHIQQFNVVNAVSLTINSDKIAALSKDTSVAAIVPDLQIAAPTVSNDVSKKQDAKVGTNAVPPASYCSTDQAAPRLEPEALQTMHVAYDSATTPSAAKLETGAGVKVGWIADGIDVNNPDFIRPNGDHVFVDYQDFSTEGVDAPSSAAEAFGDASSIAAQGGQTYNLNDYTAAANPLTAGCYVKIRGVAPGSSMVGLKVFGNAPTAPTSRFIGAVQYAVNVAGVDVLNESFGSNPYPDTMDDPISLVNNAAITAGVTVVASSGDAGTNGSIGSPATSPAVIGVAATTMFRSAAQIKLDGFSISNAVLPINGWANDNISSLSSGGYSHSGKVPDVAAPGDSGWALCSPDPTVYLDCTNPYTGAPVSMLLFGGTSQSAPLTSGTAALVIAAYRRAHNGASPTPAVVKSIIVGTAQDLGHPAYEQGSGEVDALAAVKAALSMPAPGSTTVPATATGTGLVTSTSTAGVNQLNLVGSAGRSASGSFTVTNASKSAQKVTLATRQLSKVLSTTEGSVTLDPAQTFPNVSGGARAYRIVNVNVPAGADRLDASFASNTTTDAGSFTVFSALVDPNGIFQAYNSPQGLANFGHIDARFPTPTTATKKWHLLLWANPAFTGPINYQVKSSKYVATGTVSPSSVTLAAGASAKITANFPTGTVAGDASAAVTMKTALGTAADVPVSIRTLIPSAAAVNTWTGVITGGNGRANGGPAQTNSYYVDIPAGKAAVDITVKLNSPAYPNEVLIGFLVRPDGQTVSAKSNLIVDPATGSFDVGKALFNFARAPGAGRYRFILEVTNPVGGMAVDQPFTGYLTYAAAPIAPVSPLPTAKNLATQGKTYKYSVKITNNTLQQQTYFADPRLNKGTDYQLASQVPDDDLQNLTLPESDVSPNWLVPSRTTNATFTANATVPVELDVNYTYGDPEVFGGATGNYSSVSVNSPIGIANGGWYANVGQPGPFDGPAPAGTVALNALVRTAAFDPNADSSLGDYWISSLIPASNGTGGANSGAVGNKVLSSKTSRALNALRYQAKQTPVKAKTRSAAGTPTCESVGGTLEPGKSCMFTFSVTANGAHGAVVSGALSVQSLDFYGGTTNDLISLPYAYKIR